MSLPSKLWEVRATATAGLGVFAKLPIPRGTRIFSERPLLSLRPDQSASSIYPSSLLLPVADYKWLLGLSTHTTRESSVIRWTQATLWSLRNVTRHLRHVVAGKESLSWAAWRRWSVREHVGMLNAFRNNSFNLSEKYIGTAVFKGISRINHSCVPNSQANFHAGMGRFNVHATRDIHVGEEVTVSYLAERGAVREVRVERLMKGYGFECGCAGCDLRAERGIEGEERRTVLRSLLDDSAIAAIELQENEQKINEAYAARGEERLQAEVDRSIQEAKKVEAQIIESFITVLEKGGIAGRELASLYMTSSKLYVELGKHEEALRNAERGLLLDEACLGTDHPTYQEGSKIVQLLKRNVVAQK